MRNRNMVFVAAIALAIAIAPFADARSGGGSRGGFSVTPKIPSRGGGNTGGSWSWGGKSTTSQKAPATASEPRATTSPAAPSQPATFGGTNRPTGAAPATAPGATSRPGTVAGPRIDGAGARLGGAAASQRTFRAATAPAANFTDRSGKVTPIRPNDPSVAAARRNFDSNRYGSRGTRGSSMWGNNKYDSTPNFGSRYNRQYTGWAYSQPAPIYVGGGGYNLFDFMLLNMMLNGNDSDKAEARALRADNRELEDRLTRLEKEMRDEGKTITPDMIPAAARENADLLHSDEFVAAAVNPEVEETATESASTGWGFGRILLGALLLLVVVAGAFTLVGNRDWD